MWDSELFTRARAHASRVFPRAKGGDRISNLGPKNLEGASSANGGWLFAASREPLPARLRVRADGAGVRTLGDLPFIFILRTQLQRSVFNLRPRGTAGGGGGGWPRPRIERQEY